MKDTFRMNQLYDSRLFFMEIMDRIKQQIEQNPILLYMKGSPNAPQCGFSMRTAQALMACGKPFAYLDVLSDPDVRSNLPAYGDWPTFPQLWVEGKLIGGCDIVVEMHEKGKLKTLIDQVEIPGEHVETRKRR